MTVRSSLTLVKVLRGLAGVPTAVRATFFLGGTFLVMIAALHAGCCEAAGPVWRGAGALLHCQHRLEELTAGHTLPVLPGECLLFRLEGGGKCSIDEMPQKCLHQIIEIKIQIIAIHA